MSNANIHIVKNPEAQRLNTVAWMQEWQLQERMEAVDSESNNAISSITRKRRSPAVPWRASANPLLDPLPAVGHIRMLSSPRGGNIGEPLYMAVISDWADGLVLAAPFSSYQAPANTGELQTDRAEPALAVLCPWSAVSVSPFFLARSWYIDELGEELTSAAWHVFRHMATGAPLPAALLARIGAPIIHPLDPRIRYQKQIAARMTPLVNATARLFSDTLGEQRGLNEQGIDTAASAVWETGLQYAAQDPSSISIALITQREHHGDLTVRHIGSARLLSPAQPQRKNPGRAEIRFTLHTREGTENIWHPEDGDMLRLARIEPDGTVCNLALGGIIPIEGTGTTGILSGTWSELEGETLGCDHVLVIAKI